MTVPRDFSVTLERGGCYGTCPIYSVTIAADGDVAFRGRRFTNALGPRRKRIPPEAVKQLLGAVEQIEFFSLGNYAEGQTCPQYWTDNPHFAITVTINGITKRVEHYAGCRGFAVEHALTAFEDRIDDIAQIADWKRLDPAVNQRRWIARSISKCIDDMHCEAVANNIAQRGLAAYRSDDEERAAVICSDGGIHVVTHQYAFIDSLDARLTNNELRELRTALATAPRAERFTGVARVNNGVLEVVENTPSLDTLLRRLTAPGILLSRAKTLRFTAQPAEANDGRLKPWPIETVVPLHDLITRAVTHAEWTKMAKRLLYTPDPNAAFNEFPLLAIGTQRSWLRVRTNDASPGCSE